jgi:hypothetical protein
LIGRFESVWLWKQPRPVAIGATLLYGHLLLFALPAQIQTSATIGHPFRGHAGDAVGFSRIALRSHYLSDG